MAEWSNASHSKCDRSERVSEVRILPLPQPEDSNRRTENFQQKIKDMDPQPKTLEEQLRQRIETIYRLPLGAEPRAELILILLGEKPATDVSWHTGRIQPAEVEAILHAAGLSTKVIYSDAAATDMVVARDPETVSRLSLLRADRDHQEFGRLMGFPETAIAAFVNKSGALPHDEQRRLQGELPFSNFIFSRKHAPEELALLRRWNLLIFRHAPELIDEAWDEQEAAKIKSHLQKLAEEANGTS